jgi:hypothetical protein
LEKKVVARLVDGVDLQWEPLVLEEDDHVHTFFSTLPKVQSKNFFTTTTFARIGSTTKLVKCVDLSETKVTTRL